MPKWTPDEHGCIYDEAGCFARLTPNKAERLASRHNADIDALTAERDKWRLAVIDAAVVNWTYSKEDEENPYRAVCKLMGCAAQEALDPQISLDAKALHDRIAELQRRLDAVVASLKPDGPPIPGGMFDKEVRVLWRAGIELHTKALAIAEGREG